MLCAHVSGRDGFNHNKRILIKRRNKSFLLPILQKRKIFYFSFSITLAELLLFEQMIHISTKRVSWCSNRKIGDPWNPESSPLVVYRVKTHKVGPATGNERGDIEIKDYVVLQNRRWPDINEQDFVMDKDTKVLENNRDDCREQTSPVRFFWWQDRVPDMCLHLPKYFLRKTWGALW